MFPSRFPRFLGYDIQHHSPARIQRLRRSPTPTGFAEIVSDDFPIPFHSLHRAVSTTAKYVNFVIDLRLRFSLRFI